MDNVFIATRQPIQGELPRLLGSIEGFDVRAHGPRDWKVQLDESRLYVRAWDNQWLAEPVRPRHPAWSEGDGWFLYAVQFWDIAACKAVVRKLSQTFDLWFDNDHGFEGTSDQVLSCLEQHPRWDWRTW